MSRNNESRRVQAERTTVPSLHYLKQKYTAASATAPSARRSTARNNHRSHAIIILTSLNVQPCAVAGLGVAQHSHRHEPQYYRERSRVMSNTRCGKCIYYSVSPCTAVCLLPQRELLLRRCCAGLLCWPFESKSSGTVIQRTGQRVVLCTPKRNTNGAPSISIKPQTKATSSIRFPF